MHRANLVQHGARHICGGERPIVVGSLHTADGVGEDCQRKAWKAGTLLLEGFCSLRQLSTLLEMIACSLTLRQASTTLTRGSQHPPGSVMACWCTDNTLITCKLAGEIRVIRKKEKV